KVSHGIEARVVEETHYPFDESISFTVHVPHAVEFPLYLRMPAWCDDAAVLVNGQPLSGVQLVPGEFARINQEWHDGDRVQLKLPMSIRVRRWEQNHQSLSVSYGPLTFSLKIPERLERKDSDATAIGDSKWQPGVDKSQWPSYELHPDGAWNIGLLIDEQHAEQSFKIVKREWPRDDFPFTAAAAPITMVASGKQIPSWQLDRFGLCAPLQDSPVKSNEPAQSVTLIPMGAARLRISSFPVIGEGADAHEWLLPQQPTPPAYQTTASHTFAGDTTDALSDALLPANSTDHTIPRFTWWPRQGSTEWVQYDFKDPRQVSSVSVYWFDDTGTGRCRVPQHWRLLYRDGETWKVVTTTRPAAYTVVRDKLNTVEFDEVTTDALRLEVQLQPDASSGILEWQIR
ncbi:MAG: glycoside hydrolase family 127 protein, partial [Planctomycetales bacterium]|nr:glycoside hydrolase family 127 protein [Planctomycetales bacterium]